MQLQAVRLSPEPLYEIMFAPIQTKLLLTAIKLDIFGKLMQTPKSALEIAEDLKADSMNNTFAKNNRLLIG